MLHLRLRETGLRRTPYEVTEIEDKVEVLVARFVNYGMAVIFCQTQATADGIFEDLACPENNYSIRQS